MRRTNRPKDTTKKVQLTERDRVMLRAVLEFGLVSNAQLLRFTHSTNKNALNERILKLERADFLDRPSAQRGLFDYDEERHVFNALGQRGAEWAAKEGYWLPEKKGWTYSNDQLSSKTWMIHQWGIVESYLIFRDSLGAVEGLRLIPRDELLERAPTKTQSLKMPWWYPTRFTHPQTGQTKRRGTQPDITFAIGDSRQEGTEGRRLLFTEFDNATTSYIRSDPDQSSISGMYLRYADLYRRKLHTERLGFEYFRVPIIVNYGWDRVHRMLGVFQQVAKHLVPASLFVHTSFDELRKEGPLAPIWLDGKGKSVHLVKDVS